MTDWIPVSHKKTMLPHTNVTGGHGYHHPHGCAAREAGGRREQIPGERRPGHLHQR